MFYSIKYKFAKSLLLATLLLSGSSYATTICALDCPPSGGGGGGLPTILEIFPTDGSDLNLETTGLIILDIDVYNDLVNLSINPTTDIYLGLGSLPADQTLPDTLELNTLSYTGGLSITGLANEYVLLQQFTGTTSLDLTAGNGILVINAATLTAVPLPGSVVFMFSGLGLLIGAMSRKNKI